MAKVRQDAWSHEDDLLLAETVLRHIREGSTQLKAFDEVGDKLNRTSAACGFRWNAEVRQSYEQAVQLAKKQRKDRKRAIAHQRQEKSSANLLSTLESQSTPESPVEEIIDEQESFPIFNRQKETKPIPQEASPEMDNLDQVIQCLQSMKEEQVQAQHSMHNQERLVAENKELQQALDQQQKKVKELEQELSMMKEDYQAFMQIVERARKMVVFDEEQPRPTPRFRMDKNGNLEQVAK
ncbi:RsfA family transcriptional regulator [Gracilibacillus sp. YIM 98692]|uniref:RsfA family transcriptional regulator n=1 Tax=Gracilibacillus sp. YIM 98692 TaxID=2663532 RepID=UPI0013D0F4DC|nr:RsfA family transcriptional regulator [Gracilibacillus sp. YIM 98692]